MKTLLKNKNNTSIYLAAAFIPFYALIFLITSYYRVNVPNYDEWDMFTIVFDAYYNHTLSTAASCIENNAGEFVYFIIKP